MQSIILALTHTQILKGRLKWRKYVRLLQSKEITIVLGEGSVEIDKISPCIEQFKLNTKTLSSFNSLLTRREGQDEDCIKVTSVLTLSDERVGSGRDDIDSTTLT